MVIEKCGNRKEQSLMACWCPGCVVRRLPVKYSLVVQCFLWVQNKNEMGRGRGLTRPKCGKQENAFTWKSHSSPICLC